MKLLLSLGQMHLRFGDPEANMRRVEEWTREAAGNGSELILFPELWPSGYDLEHADRYAETLAEGMFARMSTLAREHRIAIGGSLLEKRGGKVYNAFPLFDAEGRCRAVYRKTHLFALMQEDRWLAPGDRFEVADMAWGPTGMGICFDLRFPEVFRFPALRGARLVLLPAEWPLARLAHWRNLLQSRAIENQVFVAACNCAGVTGPEEFGGHSMVIDPWGEVVMEGGTTEQLLTVEIDLALVDEVRKRLPLLPARRPDLYEEIDR